MNSGSSFLMESSTRRSRPWRVESAIGGDWVRVWCCEEFVEEWWSSSRSARIVAMVSSMDFCELKCGVSRLGLGLCNGLVDY